MTHGYLISKLYYVMVTFSGLKRLNFQIQEGSPTCSTYHETVKFLLNSVLDTLPRNSNLMRWGKRSNSKYELCSHHDTLLHTFNDCPTMLNDGSYTWRHNSVLSHMLTLAQNLSKETGWIIHSNLPGHNIKCGISTVPTDICVTTQIPDIIMINQPP